MKKLEDTLTELQKQLILENFGKLLIGEISKLSGVKHRSVTKFLKNRGLKLNVNERKLLYYRRKDTKKTKTIWRNLFRRTQHGYI